MREPAKSESRCACIAVPWDSAVRCALPSCCPVSCSPRAVTSAWIETGRTSTPFPTAAGLSSTSALAVTCAVPLTCRARCFQGCNLAERNLITGYLRFHYAGIETSGRVLIGSAELHLLGTRVELAVRCLDGVTRGVQTHDHAVERLAAIYAPADIKVRTDQRIPDGTGDLGRRVERASDTQILLVGQGCHVGDRRVAKGAIAEDLAGVTGLPLLQCHRELELRAERAARGHARSGVADFRAMRLPAPAAIGPDCRE